MYTKDNYVTVLIQSKIAVPPTVHIRDNNYGQI